HWFGEFKEAQIGYQPIGNGAGLNELRRGLIDFAAVDTPLTDSQNARYAPLYFPAAVSAVVPIYNIGGFGDNLRLTPELLAGIYLGEIRYWNDVRIAAV